MTDEETPRSRGSVTGYVADLRTQDTARRAEAARRIWERYFPALLDLARRRLDPRIRQREDEQDVLQEMYQSFCRRQQRGDFRLGDRHDLWRLLVTITLRKVRNIAKRNRRQRRDYRRDAGAPLAADSALLAADWAEVLAEAGEPTPEAAAILSEEIESRLRSLDEPQRRIALCKLEGRTNDEIAQLLGCSRRTVIRKLDLIRAEWAVPQAGA